MTRDSEVGWFIHLQRPNEANKLARPFLLYSVAFIMCNDLEFAVKISDNNNNRAGLAVHFFVNHKEL